MTLSQTDRSSYFKGLLILAGRDRIINPREREWIIRIGAILDFEHRFCEAAIDDLLRNRYITHDPVVFSDAEIARCFLRDAIRLALVDDAVHHHEFVWLKGVARANGLSDEWLAAQMTAFLQEEHPAESFESLEIHRFL